MARLTGLFLRGSTYYMRVVLPTNHPLRLIRNCDRVVVSLGTGNFREAQTRGISRRAEIINGSSNPSALAHNIKSAEMCPPEALMTLRAVYERWQSGSAKSEDSSRACLRSLMLFEESIGHIPLTQINRSMGDEFRSWLRQQPTSSKTAHDRLNWIKALLNYAAIDLELLTRNPWRGLDIKAKTETPRQPWSHELVKTLISDPIWTDFAIPTNKKAGGKASYWLPLLGLYTGARCSELCQLRRDDLLHENGIWAFRISDAGANQKIKSQAARRLIPLHEELLRLGFINYWKTISSESLWPDLPKRNGRAGSYYSQFFSSLRSKLCIPNNVDFHCFRHTVRTNLVINGVAESVIDCLLGHESAGSVGARIYTHHSLKSLNEAINKFDVFTSQLHPNNQENDHLEHHI